MKQVWWKRLARRKSQEIEKRRTVRLLLEPLEDRCVPSASGFRPIDEVGNNALHPNLGTANTQLLRISPADYKPVSAGGDGLNDPSLPYGAPTFIPTPRQISNDVFNQATTLFGSQDINTVDTNGMSDFGYSWGQFIDHDMDLTPTQSGPTNTTTKDGVNGFPIPKDKTHPEDPINGNSGDLAFTRSVFDPTTGITTPRQQINVSTSYLDLSQVYGSTQTVADALRTGSGGMLKTSPGADGIIGTGDDLLPYDNTNYFTQAQINALGMANDVHLVPDSSLFAAGDPRANESTELTSLTTLFVLNHNRIASQLQKLNPTWTDEQLYQEARKLNIAEYQQVTYTAYLPDLLGQNNFAAYSTLGVANTNAYTGYDPNVDPSIATEFSTVGFRFGHSMLNNDIQRLDKNGNPIADPTGSSAVSLAQSFFNPNLLAPGGVVDPNTGHISSTIGAVLKGDANTAAQAVDTMAVSSVRNLLFGQGLQGQDLIARDIWRAHDHGIGDYNMVRQAYGLAPITNDASNGFDQITSNTALQQQLLNAYTDQNPNFLGTGEFAGNIDPFVAGLAEDHLPGSDMGPTFTAILKDQFTRLATGDQYFYLNQTYTPQEMKILKSGSTLGDIIGLNTNVNHLQNDVFLTPQAQHH